jgi:hypothetical protein
VTCTFTLGSNTAHAFAGSPSGTTTTYPHPSYITISNFEEIAAGTEIEIHFPSVKNPATTGQKPQFGVGVYKLSPSGRESWLYYTTWKTLSAVLGSNKDGTVQIANTQIVLDTTVVDDEATWKITLTSFAGVAINDYIVIQFPKQFDNLQRSTALSIGIGSKTSQPFTHYVDERMIVVKLNAAEAGGTKVLELK